MTAAKLLAFVCSAAAVGGCARRPLAPDDAGAGTIGLDGSAGGVDGSTRGPPQNAATWSAWPLANHDPANTRRSPNVGPQVPVEKFALDVSPQKMVIGGDGTIYASDWGGSYPVHAFDPATGARRWSFVPTPSVPTTVPPSSPEIAAGPEGNLYVLLDGGVRAIDVNGADLWTWSLGASARFAAALGASGGPWSSRPGRPSIG